MESAAASFKQIIAIAKRFANRLVIVGENRRALFMLEFREERARLLSVLLLALGVAAFGFLAWITLTATIVVVFWPLSPLAVLLTLTCLYGGVAVWLWQRLMHKLRDGRPFAATLDQLRKDRDCLDKQLE